MEDAVVEPARARMVPGFDSVRKAEKQAGASGACMSGAGPSLLSFVDKRRTDPHNVLDSMVEAFRARRVDANGFVTTIGEGARVVEGP
jgi:homoserine kinase